MLIISLGSLFIRFVNSEGQNSSRYDRKKSYLEIEIIVSPRIFLNLSKDIIFPDSKYSQLPPKKLFIIFININNIRKNFGNFKRLDFLSNFGIFL